MQKYAHVCRHISRAHSEFHMCALILEYNTCVPCKPNLQEYVKRIFGFYMLCAFLCAYIHALFSCLDVSHTYFCNGLKVELNNEIPVSTSLRFCIPPDLVGCVYHAPHETDSDVSLLIYYKYNILIFSFSIYPIFMQMG